MGWEKKSFSESKRRHVCQDGEHCAVTLHLHDLRVWKSRATNSVILVVVLAL